MAVNARTEKFQHLEVFDKPALFTNGRIARDTVPKGWYCYDIRGSDDDPGELCYMEENVVVNHADEEYGDYNKIGARIISRDSGNWYSSFVIDKGSNDGVYVIRCHIIFLFYRFVFQIIY